MQLAFNGTAMKDIVLHLDLYEIPYSFSLKDEEIVVEGFSKSGICTLVEDEEGNVTAHTRYNQQDSLNSFKDLVRLNNEWYQAYKDRKPFDKPDSQWADVLVQYGYLKKKVREVVEYE